MIPASETEQVTDQNEAIATAEQIALEQADALIKAVYATAPIEAVMNSVGLGAHIRMLFVNRARVQFGLPPINYDPGPAQSVRNRFRKELSSPIPN